MQPTQHYPEPTVGALIFDPQGRLLPLAFSRVTPAFIVWCLAAGARSLTIGADQQAPSRSRPYA